MKKLIATAVVAAAAYGAFAIDTGVRFEDLGRGGTAVAALNTATGNYWSEPEDAGNAYNIVAMDAYSNTTRPGYFEETQTSTNALSVKTTFGKPLSFAVNADGSQSDMGIYFDSLIKFTVCEEAPEANLYGDAKIAIWLQEQYDEDDNITGTNLVVRAGSLSYSQDALQVTQTDYVCDVVAGDFADSWHRVTIKTIADITAGSGVPGFVIYVDEEFKSTLTPKWDDLFAAQYTLSEVANNLHRDHAVFPSLKQSGTEKTKITCAQFDGTGSVNELVYTTTAPEFAKDPVSPKATITVNNVAISSSYDLSTFAGVIDAVNAEVLKGTEESPVAIKISLTKGLELDAPVEIEYNGNASVELDFNGVILTNNVASCIITNNAILTVTDSVGTGGIYANVQNGGAIYQGGSGFLTISNGNFWANIDIGESVSVEIAGGSFQQNEDAFAYEDPDTYEIGYLIAQNKWFFADGENWYTVDDAYTVTFNLNGAEGEIPSQKVRYGSSKAAVLDNVNPERAGYTLSGWLMEPDAETITADTTFTAQWTAIKYTITFVIGDTTKTIEKDYGTTITADDIGELVKTGYTGAWYDDDDPLDDVVEGAKTYTYTYTATPYTITYVLVAGSEAGVAPATGSYTVESGTVTLTQPAAVASYTFSGWYADQDLTGNVVTQFTVDPANLENKTFYGKFTADTPADPETPEIPAGETSVEVKVDIPEDANDEVIAGILSEAVNSVTVAAPSSVVTTPEQKAEYQDLFDKKAEIVDGKVVVTAEIKETVKEAVAQSAVDVLNGVQSATVEVPQGLFYKVTTMTQLGGSEITVGRGLSDGSTPISVSKPGTTSGFIKIQIGTQAYAE